MSICHKKSRNNLTILFTSFFLQHLTGLENKTIQFKDIFYQYIITKNYAHKLQTFRQRDKPQFKSGYANKN